MIKRVYIRPLEPDDAFVTYQWRNNPSIWPFSGLRPGKFVSPLKEYEWLKDVLQRENERRFAICLKQTDQVVGCIYLTDISKANALLHIYFGELQYWGSGRAYEACNQLFEYSFNQLHLDNIFIEINPKNRAAVALAKQMGYEKVEKVYDSNKGVLLDKMIFSREMYMQRCSS